MKINPLDVLKIRKLPFTPEYFKTITVQAYRAKELEDWIVNNLKGRYSFVRKVAADPSGGYMQVYEVGFESKNEWTMFMVGCPNVQAVK